MNNDSDYNAFDLVGKHLGDYKLTTSSTKNLSKVKHSNNSLNYLLSVMEDMNGNEGYVLVNYNNAEENGVDAQGTNKKHTITLEFSRNVTKVVIYRNGVASEVSVENGKIQIPMAVYEGVIIIPSKLGK